MKNLGTADEIIHKAFKFHSQGNILKAEKYYQYFINQGFKDHRVFSNYGVILKDLGKLKDAELSTRKAIKLNPDYAVAHSNLGGILQDLGELKDAELSARKAIKLNPDLSDAHLNLGSIFKDLEKLEDAELSTRKAIELNPSNEMAHSNLGCILQDLEKLEEAELSIRKAIEINPNFEMAYLNLGTIFKDLGKLKDAEFSYRKAIEINPNYADAYFNLFHHYEEINNLGKLKESLDEFKKIDNIENELILFRARLNFRNKKHQTAKKLIDNISPEWIDKTKKIQKIIFWNFKAFINDKVGNYDLAYFCFEKSQKNLLYKRFSKDSYLNYINNYKKSINGKRKIFNRINDGIVDSNLAFLIGFPRSGTTLLDTILRSHKDIEVIEEKPLISSVEKVIKRKFNTKFENLFEISEDNIIILRQHYLEILQENTNTKGKLLIDKFPLNTSKLPLINILFPNAKIIFSHRHPYDTVLSCFQQYFKPNEAMTNLVSLQSSSIMYDEVMNAWDIYKNNLHLDFITSKYENLIENFDSHILKILDFLGVGWDENVKNYRKTAIERDRINTPSSSQVVQPLYKSSINKWKNYEKYFEHCHQYLEKWVSYFDY